MPAGVKKPKQKASVEGTVGKIATAIIARCRNDVYYSLADLKKAVAKNLDKFNHEPFQKREGSRYKVLQEELEYLHPLPDIPYEISDWIYNRTVNLDFHALIARNNHTGVLHRGWVHVLTRKCWFKRRRKESLK